MMFWKIYNLIRISREFLEAEETNEAREISNRGFYTTYRKLRPDSEGCREHGSILSRRGGVANDARSDLLIRNTTLAVTKQDALRR